MCNSVKRKNSAYLLIYGRNVISNSMLQFLYCVCAIPVYKFFQVSPQEAIWDCEVWQPHKPWDTLHMKMDFVTHYHITYSTKPLLLEQVLK